MSASVSNEYGSAHDSLCPVLDPVNYWDDCQCDLIAKVRETTPPSCVCKFGRGYAAALRDAVEAVNVTADKFSVKPGAPIMREFAAAIEALSVSADTDTNDGERRQ